MGHRVNPLDPMAADVLEPFVAEWAERARRAQVAVDAILAGSSKAPRIERRRRGKADRYVLVRRDGDEERALHGPDAKEVTVVLSEQEWSVIVDVVLLQHGLTALAMPAPEQEGTA